MIRLLLLGCLVGGLAVLAFRDWYKSLCGLILLMAVVEHPDMPKTILGVQGLNPWNILLGVVIFAWAVSRRNEGARFDPPGGILLALSAYFLVILAGFGRMLLDMDSLGDWAMASGEDPPTRLFLVSEYLINTLKWIIPGVLLFDGCRSPERFYLGLVSTLAVYFLLGLQVIRWMPLEDVLSGVSLAGRSLKILLNEVGYHRVNLSMMLSGAMWAMISASYLTRRLDLKTAIVAGSLVILLAQSLTGGRMGYATWAVVGLVLSVLRFRKFLFVLPAIAFAVVSVVPGAYERMTQGFAVVAEDPETQLPAPPSLDDEPDLYTITAGRNIAWPHVVEKIGDAPFIGFGRLAMIRTGISGYLWNELGESFPHPHNAFLEWVLDNGLIGAVPVLLSFLLILKFSISLLLDARSPIYIAIGGGAVSLVAALLVASIGSQTFYPREGAVGMWCMIGLMLRVHRLREAADLEPQADDAQHRLPWESQVA
jgi:O-antigen ligase